MLKPDIPSQLLHMMKQSFRQWKNEDYLSLPHVEMEMLYGIRPDVSKRLKGNGRNIRLYLTYGTEWYLYLCHRLAEYPPNIYAAIADMLPPPDANKSLLKKDAMA